MNADGSDQTKLVGETALQRSPLAWSPDSRRLAFVSARDSRDAVHEPNWDIYVIDADGSGLTRLTNNPGSEEEPAWSPDGRSIMFVRAVPTGLHDARYSIHMVNADGSRERLISDDRLHPSWSPDGRRIAFTSYRDNGYGEIYVIGVDGSGQRRLTNNNLAEYGPRWSPDGNRLAFVFYREDAQGSTRVLSVMSTDGSRQTNLEDSGSITDLHSFAWSLDGRRLIFVSARDTPCPGCQDLWAANSDGSGQIRVTSNSQGAFVGSPSWQPLPRRYSGRRLDSAIAFAYG